MLLPLIPLDVITVILFDDKKNSDAPNHEIFFFSAFLYFLSLRCILLSQHAILKRSPIYILPLEGQTMFYTHTRKKERERERVKYRVIRFKLQPCKA